MKDSRAHDERMDAALAERLLDAYPTAAGDGRADALEHLLAVAAAPLPGDPERERAALAAFREARAATSGGRGRRRVRGVRPARRTRAALGGLVAVFALGGVAVAAQSGSLPGPFHSGTAGPRPVSPSPSSAPANPGGGTRTASPRAPQGTTATPTAPPVTSGGPHASVPPLAAPTDAGSKGLCQTYVKAAEHHKGVNAATLARLERAAGGAAAVPAYCARLIGAPEVTPPPVHPETPEGGRHR
ncbi:hypothetical protein [Actinacidiphila glaucinigra]|uniref:hypothetical protein n=1 Tax=Actinacidiphila glaucinigra TaxID=235986 RepID=UPI00366B7C80